MILSSLTFVLSITLLVAIAEGHEVGDGSGVVIETKVAVNVTPPVDWPEGKALATCVQTGLLSQKRSGAYTLTLYFNESSNGNIASYVLVGENALITKYTPDRTFSWSLKEFNRVSSPPSSSFDTICGALTNTHIVFERVPTTWREVLDPSNKGGY